MSWFHDLVRWLYFRYQRDDELHKWQDRVLACQLRIIEAKHEIVKDRKHIKYIEDQLAKYNDCVPLPRAPEPEALRDMLKAVAEKEKARQPIDCTDLYKLLVSYCAKRELTGSLE